MVVRLNARTNAMDFVLPLNFSIAKTSLNFSSASVTSRELVPIDLSWQAHLNNWCRQRRGHLNASVFTHWVELRSFLIFPLRSSQLTRLKLVSTKKDGSLNEPPFLRVLNVNYYCLIKRSVTFVAPLVATIRYAPLSSDSKLMFVLKNSWVLPKSWERTILPTAS